MTGGSGVVMYFLVNRRRRVAGIYVHVPIGEDPRFRRMLVSVEKCLVYKGSFVLTM